MQRLSELLRLGYPDGTAEERVGPHRTLDVCDVGTQWVISRMNAFDRRAAGPPDNRDIRDICPGCPAPTAGRTGQGH